jgi:magnesium-transporting ATPase (P-type)
MAQTKRKRQTKHRGTAAGVVTSRGRTSKPPSADVVKKQKREDARVQRLTKKPTWKSSSLRALLAAAFICIFLLISTRGNVLASIAFAAIAALIYIPAGFYLETFLWRRRMRKQGQPTS